MKSLIICIAPIAILLWVALSVTKGFVEASAIMGSCCAFTFVVAWWVKFCVDHFSDDD